MKQQHLSFRKPLIAAVLGFFTVLSVSAQQQHSSSGTLAPKIGVKGGVNFSNLYVDDVEGEKMKAGLNLGLFAKFPLTRGISLQPELLYSSQGSKIEYNSLLNQGEYRFNLNYLQLPFLAVFNVTKNLNIHAGPYVAYLTKANIKAEDNGESNEELVSFDEDDFNRFDYGLSGGIGFDVKSFTLGARYNYGLNEVGKKDNITSTTLKDSKNSVISVYVGYGF